jgi:hypothetical protein
MKEAHLIVRSSSPVGHEESVYYVYSINFILILFVPDLRAGLAWDRREMGSACGRGAREGPAPQEAGKISSQCSARAGETWSRKKRNRQVGYEEEGLVRTVSE